jgi:hypothetical protein
VRVTRDALVNLLTTAVIVGVLITALILFAAPTWAWVGFGALAWLNEVKFHASPSR